MIGERDGTENQYGVTYAIPTADGSFAMNESWVIEKPDNSMIAW